ncbi:MAG: asparaginase [Deltaproteobacteria bacterium]|nr:asparaginase [Deltaproteobacteria bacterium]
MKIKIIATGGTIDKIYFDRKGEFQVGEPQAIEILKEANVCFDYEVVSLLRKDSLDLTADDREKIFRAVADDDNHLFVITHGTDTMVETARKLQGIKDKVVVFTGAMQPARFHLTDAIFNLAAALTAVQTLPCGVYIAMNGMIFSPDRARKNVEMQRFENI